MTRLCTFQSKILCFIFCCLGITVSPDKEGDGLIVRSVIAGGAIERAGEPQLGDMIRHVNNDSAVGLGAAQARALIRNHSMYSKDVK